MTPNGNVGANVAWAVRVFLTFVVFGGIAGGLVIGAGFPVIGLASNWPEHLDPQELVLVPFFVMIAGGYGIAVGLPASVMTGIVYIVGRSATRRIWRLTVFGAIASAAWGALIVGLMTWSSPAPSFEAYTATAGIFAVCGAVATLSSFRLLERWDLHRPA